MELSRSTDDSILIGLTGDVMIGRLVEERLSFVAPEYIWGDTLPTLRATDMNLINLEAALTISERAVFKTFNFKAKPERVEALVLASVDVANLANNHCLDYAEEGLLETLDVLDKAKIKHIGGGRSAEEAIKPVLMDVEGVKIGILGCTDNEPTWEATPQSPGTNYIEISDHYAEKVAEEVRKLRDQVDILILTIHWGPNMRERPSTHFKNFAHRLIDCGVDIFHGHSAHIFQGVEIYNGKVIFYDTGDFVDDYYVDPFLRNDRSFFYLVECTKEGILGIRLVPTLIGNCQVNLSTGIEKEETMERMTLLSRELNTELTEEEDALVAKVLHKP
ncbi:MAG: putative polyglutamine synthesis accessory protein [Chlamydiae bacterium]|nr:putative polyglutamine synthesis accessory protein [Chlamydiota bacterium]